MNADNEEMQPTPGIATCDTKGCENFGAPIRVEYADAATICMPCGNYIPTRAE